MARKEKDEIKADFFSFLDILSGVIGVMSLIIVGMVVISIQTQPQILKTSDGSEMNKLPHFVECSNNGIIMQPENYPIAFDRLRTDPALEGRLDYLMRNTGSDYLLFLVHQDGGRSFDVVSKMAEDRNLQVGKEPMPLKKRVTFEMSDGTPIEGNGLPADYRRKESEFDTTTGAEAEKAKESGPQPQPKGSPQKTKKETKGTGGNHGTQEEKRN